MRSKWFNAIPLLTLLLGMLFPMAAQAAPSMEPSTAPVPQETPNIEVEAALRDQLARDETAGYMIYFREKADLSPAYKMDWIARGRFVANALNQTALHSQASVRAYLDARGIKYKAFWIDNVISVESSNRATFNGLLNFPSIEAIRQHRELHLIEPEQVAAPSAPQAIEPNILHVLADQVWAEGYTGEGIVVASVDTGVRYTHDALVNHYRGNLGGGTFDHNYNWWDPYGDHPTEPGDDNGHGSHTMGTMVGDDGGANQIGMAPGAKWMACRGCSTSDCGDVELLECAQFFAAPWDLTGANANPDKRPNAVNNSWGDCSTSYDPWYQDVVDAWHAAGIYPVFSNGNASNCGYPEPPGLNTVGNPARYGNVTGVGSTGRDNGQYAPHSNWGPTDDPDTVNPHPGWADLKPQVLAPGVNIRSSVNTGDSAYQGGWGGTSMSAPHVTGLVALMWSAAPCLIGDYAATETIIENTATPIPYDDGTGGGAHVPNYAAGWGEINALAAVEAAAAACGDSTIVGQVTDATTSTPVAGATVVATSETAQRKAASDAEGFYTLTVFSDTYTLAASRYGYQTTVIPDVVATTGMTTTQNIALTPAAMYEVSGQVTDAATGWPLYAHISVTGDPFDPPAPDNAVWTDPTTGEYSLMLAEGITYTFEVEAWVDGYGVETGEVGPLTADAPGTDFALQADMGSCAAPGYSFVGGLMANFEDKTFPPAGWTVVNNGGTCEWAGDDPEGRGNLTGGTGKFAIADSDACGSGTTMNTDLVSPPFDVSGLSQVNLSFAYDYNNLSSSEVAAADVSADGGATWVNVVTWTTDQRGPATFTQDVTALLAGSTQARVRFHYYAPGWDWWWEVDNVVVGNPVCQAPTDGGLVVGNVYDANFPTLALNGATVVNAVGGETTAKTTPADAAVDDAFYTLFAPSGPQVLTATMTGGYGPDVATVTVVDGGTVEQDFQLPAGLLDATPDGIDVTVELGFADSATLTLANTGGVGTAFELKEADRGFMPLGVQGGYIEPLPASKAILAPEAFIHNGDIKPAAVSRTPYIYHGPMADAAIIVYADDSLHTPTMIESALQALGLTYTFYGYDEDGNNLSAFTAEVAAGGWDLVIYAADSWALIDASDYQAVADHVNNGGMAIAQSWAIGYDAAHQNHALWTALGADYASWISSPSELYWWNAGHPLFDDVPEFTDLTDLGYTAYGASMTLLGDPDTGLGGFTTSPADGEAGVILREDGKTIYKGLTDNLNDGDLDGDSIFDAAEWWTNAIDYVLNPGAGDVPWLSESPTTGTLAPSGAQDIVVSFDAAYVEQPGNYYAQIKVDADTPYDAVVVPVTMTVTSPQSWGKLTGTVTGLGVCDGDPAPLEEAEVFVESATTGQTWMVTTDENGVYTLWIDQAHSPLTITVTAPDYFGETSGVVVQQGQTTVVDFDLRILLPCLSYDPTDFDVTLPMGDNTVELLTLSNTGAGTAEFELVEKPGGFTPLSRVHLSRVTIGDVIGDNAFTANPQPASVPSASYPMPEAPDGMETLTHSVSQEIISGNSVACNNGSAHTDNSYLRTFTLSDFGITSDFSIVEVDMGIEMASGGSGVQPVEVRLYTLDGDLLWENMTLIGQAAVEISDQELTHFAIPVTGVAPAGSTLVVEFFTPDGNTGGNLLFVGSNNLGQTAPSYLAAADCGATEPTDVADIGFPEMHIVMNVTGMTGGAGGIPWLTETPISGTLAADTAAVVDLGFDAGVPETMQPGTYYGQLKVNHNAVNEVPNVPVTLTVTAPDTWGKVAGVVTGLGYCDVATPTLLAGAAVTLTSGTGLVEWSLLTDENGAYQLWLDEAHSPVTITVAYPEHITKVFTDVVVTAGATTVVDAALRWAMPCLSVDPDMFDVTVTLGMSTTVPFTLTNAGAGDTPFDLAETNGGVNPLLPQLLAPTVAATGGTAVSLLQFGESNVTLAGSVVSPHFSEEDILLDQAPNQDNGIFSDAGCDACGSGVQVVAENFSLETEETIGQIVLWSGYHPGDTPIDPDHLTVIFHADASGSPGTALSTETDVPYERVQTGVVLFGVHEWMHTLTLANPVTLEPGTYWVEIYNDTGSGTDDFFWETGDADTVGNGLTGSAWATQAPGSSWNIDTATEMAIQLIRATGGAGGDIPWLSENPVSGAVDADDTFVVDLTFDASSAITQVTQPGAYFGTLFVHSNDPVNNKIVVPVTMTVLPPDTWGKLRGTVTGLGYCDADPAPLAGADVLIEGSGGMTWTVTTDISGTYQVWLDEMYSPVTITVSYPEHEKGEATVAVTGQMTTTQDFNLHWLVPCVAADPLALHTTLELGATATEVLTLTNAGAVDTDWSLTEENLGDLTVTDPGVVTLFTEAFEGAFPPAGWTRVENIGSCDWESSVTTGYTNQTGGAGLFADANSDWCGDAMDAELRTPALDLSAAAAPVLSFQSDYRDLGDDAYVDVSTDGGTTWTNLLHYDGVSMRGPRRVQLDLAAYAGQPSVIIRFHYVAPGWDWYWQVDDVQIADVDPVTWLAEAPASGALVADTGEQVVAVDFDASVAGIDQPGDYLANLWIHSDDPFAPAILPVTMTVTPPATWGELRGTVTSLGRCDANPAPLEGATVVIMNGTSVTLTTDISGTYSYWLSTGTYTVTVAAADHVGDAAVVIVPAASAVTQDFSLTWLGPCVTSITPSSMEVTVAMGVSTTLPLTMTNAGAGALNFAFSEADGGFMPMLMMAVQQAVQASTLTWNAEKLAGECAVYVDSTLAEPAEAKACYDFVPESNVFNMPMSPSDIGYALEMYNTDTVVTFPLNNFTGQTVVGALSASYYGVDFDPTATTLYALNDNTDQLGTLDLTTGAFTSLVPCPPGGGAANWTGLTIDPVAGTFYASTATDLYTIDPATGASTLVGPFGTSLMIDIAMNPAGEMYGHDIGTDSIYQINPATGAATLIGPTGYAANYAQGMDFDNDDGTLYIFLYQGGGANVFGTVNLTTGAVTPLAVSAPQGEFEGAIQIPGAKPIPWLFEDPESGAVPAMTAGTADIIFDAGVPEVTQPGTYAGLLTVNNSDPVWDGFSIPVTMHVTLPATYGRITGTVTGLGPCDDPATAEPLAGADVTIASATQTWTLTTDAAGGYALWLDEAHSPVTLTVEAAGYVTGVVTGVHIISGTTTVQDFTLRPLAPCFAGVTPAEAHVTVALGVTATTPITVVNTGAAALSWSVEEADGGFQIMAPSAGEDVLVVAYDTTAAPAMETALTNLGYTYLQVSRDVFQAMAVADLLEYKAVLYAGGYSGDSWAKAMAYLDAGGSFLIADNDFGYGNGSTAFYQTYLQSTYVSDGGSDGQLTGLDIMTGINPDISADPYPDDFTVGAEGTCIFDAPSPNCAGVKVQRLDYKAIYLAWDFQYSGGLQDAILGVAVPWLAPAGVPWLDEDPTSGTVAPDATEPVTLTFDASVPEVAQPGDYYATLTFKGADVEVEVPVTMTVEPPATWGKLEGLVQGLGYCNVMTAPLEGAVVFVESAVTPITWTVETDADGMYGVWLDESYSPLTVTVSYEAGYEAQVFTGVEIVSGTVTTLNANLIWLQPCIVTDPDALALSVSMGTTETVSLNLANMGAVTGTFLLNEWSLGFNPLGPLATGGPDAFGYRFADSNDFGISPVYDFVDISGIGTPIALGDNDYAEVPIGFDFKFYGNSAVDPNVYNSVFVSSNGFLSFGAGSTDLSPDPALPDPTLPNNLIAAAWDDLKPGVGGMAYVESFAQCPYNPYLDTVDACFIVQYDNFVHADNNPAGTWEVILFRTGSILLQYATVDAPDATTGIEAQLGLIGLNYGPTLADELAICFAYPGEWLDCQSTQVPWLATDVTEGSLAAHDDATIAVTFDASVLEVAAPGDYLAELRITSNDPVNPFQVIPVTMTVEQPTTMGRLAGVVSGWSHCDAVSETLAGAQVAITTSDGKNVVLTTDADGAYATWLPVGPYTLTASAAGYVPVTLVGVVQPTMQSRNVDLRLDAPCVSVTYDQSFDVVVVQGQQLTRTLSLNNDGAGLLTYDNVLATGLWLTVDPKTGSVAPDSAQPVNVVFDATGLDVGVYNSSMEIVHNDTEAGQLFVRPIRMTVVAQGTVLTPVTDAKAGNPGETVTYVMTVTNSIATAVTFDITATDNVWTTNVPATVTVAASGTATFTVSVDIPVDAHSGYSDTVTITAKSQGADGQVDAVVLQTTVAEQPVVLVLTKTADPADYVLPGDTITYTLTLANNGNDPLTIALTDTIPAGTTYVAGSVTGGATLQDPPGSIVWEGSLADGAQHTITFQVTVNAGLATGTLITNTVTATGGGLTFTDDAVVTVGSGGPVMTYIYLPLVLRNAQ